ncbi:sensor histidine kinase [Streptococcus pacificus]|uniref:GHKL domain-containing protein n=1 Tax=Streptococcus pacificus TaxID=2740577 RepID=A0ABS0ZJ70_9STRE|nr:GHKL domain-containing protein [Streptococcus pacificus]MBJ8326066.1 GHKL domain-containing protein [Streptococcus pacificus]
MENFIPTFMFVVFPFISLSFDFILFSKINKRVLTWRELLFAFLLRFPIAGLILVLIKLTQVNIFVYFDYPLYMVIISFLFLRPLPKSLLIFYGLFPPTLYIIFNNAFSFFILPIFGLNEDLLEKRIWNIIVNAIVVFICLMFLRWLRYDFSRYKTQPLDVNSIKLFYLTNWLMVLYHIVFGILNFMDFEKNVSTIIYRELIVIIYLIFFMGLINQMDRRLREQVQEQLSFQKDLQLKGMENYNKQIEGLYKDIRSFRHDYINLLTTLRLGIESEDINQVKSIYSSVLKDSDLDFKNHKYDLGRLVNINNPALKSLLATKFIQATEKHFLVTIDVPEVIEPQKMDLIDFVTVVSILCDNAIEAKPQEISIAFFSSANKQLFIVENTIKEERMDISRLYDYGVSTKGKGRGIGLYNVMKIIERYPNVSLKTSAQNYCFSQVLEIYQ